MTYAEIFKEIYHNNRKFILTYLTICLVFSMLAFGNSGAAQASSDISNAEVISTLGGEFGAKIGPLVQGGLVAYDMSSSMLIFSAISLSFDHISPDTMSEFGDAIGVANMESLLNYSFGIWDYNAVRIFCLIWFVIAKLSKSNRISYTTSVILENYESKITAFVLLLTTTSQYLANLPLGNTVQAASASGVTSNIVTRGFSALICFMLLVSVLVIYALIRCLFYFLDIIVLPTCTVTPFAALGLETAKTVSIIGLLRLALEHPYVFCFIFVLILIIAIALFRKAYITIRYFKNIYVKPFFKRFGGYDSDIPLIAPKVPRKVMRYVGDTQPNILIPVYALKKLDDQKGVRKHDRWWFVSTTEKQYLCKPVFLKTTCRCVELNNLEEKKIFIKKSLRFFEIFNLKGTDDEIGRPFHMIHKRIHFVFSKEYYYRFETIKELTKFTDYTEYKNQIKENLKMTRKEKRLAKRMARLEAKEEKRIAKQNKKLLLKQNQ